VEDALKKFSTDIALQLKAAFASQSVEDFVKTVKASGDDRTFEVVMSTSDEDRQGDALDQSGWDLKYYTMNPVVLWAHNYGSFPIGVVTDIETKGNETIATGKFAPEGVNPDADMACKLYQAKILRAVSPGYIQNDDGTRELLEVSFCPVPAGRYALSLRQVSALGMNERDLVTKGFFYETKGTVPYHDYGIADPDEAWDGPTQVKQCGDDIEKLKSICTWFDSEDADVKSSYKLPHHRASDRKAVWKGVAAAGSAISGARGGVQLPEKDLAAIKAHLAKHYKQFGKTPPWEEKSAKSSEIGDACELDDGTPGTLADDSDNPGSLVCVPSKTQKSESMNDELEKKFKAEHERHGKAVAKAIDEFKSIDEFTKDVDSEQGEHLAKCMKSIDENYELQDQKPEKKSIDEFKSEISAEHLKHVKSIDKSLDEFKGAHESAEDDEKEKAIQEFTKAAGEELDRHEKAHGEILKAHEDEPESDDDLSGDEDEKAIIEAIRKSGRAISRKTKEQLKSILEKMESHHNEATAALKELIGSEDGDGGEEPSAEPKGDEKALNSRSSTSGATAELETYLFTQRLVRQVKSASEGALRQINEKIKKARTSSR
jgi:hypothetical protein